MKKGLVIRILAIFVLISYFLPWQESFIEEYSGVEFIKELFAYDSEESLFVAKLLIVIAILAMLVVVIPRTVPIILFLLPSFFFISAFSSEEELPIGMSIFVIGSAGIFLAFVAKLLIKLVVKIKKKTESVTTTPQSEIVNVVGSTGNAHFGKEGEQDFAKKGTMQFCENCGTGISAMSKFCQSCGSPTK